MVITEQSLHVFEVVSKYFSAGQFLRLQANPTTRICPFVSAIYNLSFDESWLNAKHVMILDVFHV